MTATSVNPLGKLALIDDAKRARAVALVKSGRVYDLGHVLDEHVPVFPGRYFKQTLVTTAHHANPGGGVGENEVNWITELVSGTMQLGTHLDALSHLQMGNRGYGGLTVEELADTSGVRQLGIETVPQIVTRGWLVDVPGLGAGEVIGPEHCVEIDPEPGDAVLFHTGWSRHWHRPEVYLSGEPGRDASWRSGWPTVTSR
jgi:kynurenine formamidase